MKINYIIVVVTGNWLFCRVANCDWCLKTSSTWTSQRVYITLSSAISQPIGMLNELQLSHKRKHLQQIVKLTWIFQFTLLIKYDKLHMQDTKYSKAVICTVNY